ncbi:MAG: hypothetical protein ACMUIA_10190 [bacterium]
MGKRKHFFMFHTFLFCLFCLVVILGNPQAVKADSGDLRHQVHLSEARGPGLGTNCYACHRESAPGGPPDPNSVDYDLCIPCHSPDGAYDGMHDPAIGALNNLGSGDFSALYESDGLLRPGKEKWCVGCHDDGSCVMQGVTAPNIAGQSISEDWSSPGSIHDSDISDAHNLLDGDPNTGNTGGGSYMLFDLGSSVTISHLRLYSTLDSTNHWGVYGGDDPNSLGRILLGRSVLFAAPTWQTGPQEGWNETRLDRFISIRYLKLTKINPWPLIVNSLRELEIKKDLQYGYYATGHKISCTQCHDVQKIHIDGNQRTYTHISDPYNDLDPNNYQNGYRLRTVEIEGINYPPMEIPRTGCNWGEFPRTDNDFALCFRCHDKNQLLGDAYSLVADAAIFEESETVLLQTNFRNDQHKDVMNQVTNEHLRHLRGRYPCGKGADWDSDWDGVSDSPQSCTGCHNVHGTPSPAMIRHGELTSTPGTFDKASMINLAYIDEVGTLDFDLSNVLESIGAQTQFYGGGPGTVGKNNTCNMCHNDQVIYYRLAVPSPVADCLSCHDGEIGNHFGHPNLNCTGCHGFRDVGIPHGGGITSSTCGTCHVDLQVSHKATPGSGWVVIHADTDHDDAGWYGPKPYFDVEVDCITCHTTDLLLSHGHDCLTCHPAPYNTLENNWLGGCQQGGCHTAYHEDSTMAHWPFEDAYDEVHNDCDLCHNPGIGAVVQENCLNCHATYGSGDITPPMTSLKNHIAEAIGPDPIEFVGTARIEFSILDNGNVGIGRTFYRLDGGPQTAAMNVMARNDHPGTHVLEYWSKDQAGNIESPKTQTYTMVKDTTAPTTTSDARTAYYQGGKITFTATDGNSTMGVKETCFSLNGGPVQTGTSLNVPVKSGTYTYTLDFWSVDWSGNSEPANSVTFTVTGGTGTLKLVWGNSDVNPDDRPTGDDWAEWYIRRDGFNGPLVASGFGAAPNWDGVDYVTVPVIPNPYFVRIDWQWEGEQDQTDFANIYVTTPGQVIRLSY